MKSHNESKCYPYSADGEIEAACRYDIILAMAQSLLNDCARLSTYYPSKDIDTLMSRTRTEGLSFLTITLPRFGSDLMNALEIGAIQPTHFQGFRKRGAIPAFLSGMLCKVFGADDGKILPDVDVAYVAQMRQVTLAFKKLNIPCSVERINAALAKYRKDDDDLSVQVTNEAKSDFISVARALWTDLCTRVSDLYLLDQWFPKHGPGAVSDYGISGNKKYLSGNWHLRLEPYFPYFGTKMPIGLIDDAFRGSENCSKSRGSKGAAEFVEIQQEYEPPVKVTTVPKTLKSPRIIAIEPCCNQFTQQAVAGLLIPELGKYRYTKGQILFKDQEVHRALALRSSKLRNYATLDLSSASDRVPNYLVKAMFGSSLLGELVQATRSSTAILPDSSEIITLRKFASMGSSLCFPVEAMYFYTICVMALMKKRGLPLVKVAEATKDVFIYGDDIIVPNDEVECVIDTLQKYHCKVGVDKSFYRGKFRESCGMDAYDGVCVTPTYIRSLAPLTQDDASAIAGWVSASRQFFRQGYWLTADLMKNVVEGAIGELPITQSEAGGLGFNSFLPAISIDRWHTELHVPKIRTWVVEECYQDDNLDGWPALVKCLTTPMNRDKRHLQRSTRKGVVKLKRRWVACY